MASPLLIAVESACAQLASSALSSASLVANTYTGIGKDDKEAPAVICYALEAREDSDNLQTGIWRVSTSIKVKEMAADVAYADIGNLSSAIFNMFLNNQNIITDLNNKASNLVILDVFRGEQTDDVEESATVQSIALEVVCMSTN